MADIKKWDYKKLTPFHQVAFVLGLLLLFNFGSLGGVETNESGMFTPDIFWTNCIAMVLVYALFNSVLSVLSETPNKYWGQSMMAYLILCVVGGLMAYGFSGLSMDEAGSYRWLFFVLTFGYLIFMAMMRTMRKIVELAQKQDSRLRGED